jgi:hypothetical protein
VLGFRGNFLFIVVQKLRSSDLKGFHAVYSVEFDFLSTVSSNKFTLTLASLRFGNYCASRGNLPHICPRLSHSSSRAPTLCVVEVE